eukprot:TRINITY_DN104469_c0_g1_i1.p1 TRINITY_DN104469_c0_g1~~TRINITY_DN104469_c0_g1_i1.p1  ORF type:complete len:421 (+),score=133.44 TRINITY_DN104469_c0_g1_i1:70-1332(+)
MARKGSKSMDILKSALAERQAKAQKTISETGQKWVRRGELEAKRVEEYFADKKREEEKWQADEEARFQKLDEHFAKGKQDEETKKVIPAHLLDMDLLDDNDEPPISVEEIVNRFRDMSMPIMLFGETDMQRYKRMRQLEKEDHEGKKNPDLIMLDMARANENRMELEDRNEDDEDGEGKDDKKHKNNSDSDGSESDGEGKKQKAGGKDNDSDSDTSEKHDAAPSGEQQGEEVPKEEEKKAEEVECPDVDVGLMDKSDMIRAWIRKSLKAWEKELADLPDEDKKKPMIKTAIAAHRQVRRDVRPLQKRLRVYAMDPGLLDKIHTIVSRADQREYRSAAEAYIDLTVGKAAWPLGFGHGGSMLMEDAIGLHDRENLMKNKQLKDVSSQLNDEVTRKYVQSLKRLMNQAQNYWPPDAPSNRCT